MVRKDGIDESYFLQHPIIRKILDTDSGEVSTNSSNGPSTRKTHYRPHTPPFPPTTSRSGIQVDCKENDILIPKTESAPNLSCRSSYAHLLSRLRDNSERERKEHQSSRSGSRSSSSNLNVVLRLLSLETARADAAESQLARDNEAILTRVRNIREAHVSAQAELVRVNTELAMYKFQLDLAHKEIRRAQVIIDEAQKGRAEAAERCIMDREKIRELVLQRAIDEAREEGRREGWRLGLERGRWDVRASQRDQRHLENAEQTETYKETGHKPTEPELSLTAAPGTRAAIRTSRPSALPILEHPSNSYRKESKRRSSEYISFQNSRRSSSSKHPRSLSHSETCSPGLAPSRRSVKSHNSIPLDGFIPTLGSHEHIALPPPHGLSVPMDLTEPTDDARISAGVKGKGIDPQDRGTVGDIGLQTPQEHVYDSWRSIPNDHPDRDVSQADQRDGYETPAYSAVSNRSTRISEFDIVRPPNIEALNNRWYSSPAEEQSQQLISFYAPRPATKDDISTGDLDDSRRIAEERSSIRSNNHEALQVAASKAKNANEVGALANLTYEPPQYDFVKDSRVHSPRAIGGPCLLSSASEVSDSDLAHRASYIYRTNNPPRCHPSGEAARTRSAINIYPQSTLPTSGPPTSGPTTSNYEPRATVQKSTFDVTVPGIDVEPPSHSPTNTSPGTTVNPVLLTPEHINHLTVVPDPLHPPHNLPGVIDDSLAKSVLVEQLPPGFVPLHPISSVTDSKSIEDDHLKSPKHNSHVHNLLHPTAAFSDFSMERSPGLDYSPAPATSAAQTLCAFSCPDTDVNGRVLITLPHTTPYDGPYSVFDCVYAVPGTPIPPYTCRYYKADGTRALGTSKSDCLPKAVPCSEDSTPHFSTPDKVETPPWIGPGNDMLYYKENPPAPPSPQ
ncbi:hypothetical protein C0995_002317 [Termitomyces sp. Mi166|nr:hypothetical protein C0995_002317 [Termitomyces sp. Mi166\